MSEAYAPWLTDPDDPADIPTPEDNDAAAKNVFAAYPDLVDTSNDGPIADAKEAITKAMDGVKPGDPQGPLIVKTFHEALDILDQSEPIIRDMIESNLMNVAGIEPNISKQMLSRNELSQQIAQVRQTYIKAAFRHLRDNLPND